MNAGGEGRKKRITTATGRKPRSPPVQTTDQSQPDLKLANGIELIKSAWSDMKEKERELNQMRTENQYLRKTLDELHRNIIDGGRMSQRESKALSDMQDDQLIKAAEAITKEVTQKFDETKANVDYAARLLEELDKYSEYKIKQNTIFSLSEPPIAQPRAGNKDNKREIQGKNDENPNDKQLQKNFETASSVLEKLINATSAQEERDCLLLSLEHLSHVRDPSGGNKEENIMRALDQIQSSVKKDSSADKGLIHAKEILVVHMDVRREAEYTASLLEGLNKYSGYEGKQDTPISLKEPPIEKARGSSYNGDREDKQNGNTRWRHDEQLQKQFKSASSVLDKLILSEQVGLAVTHENPAITDLRDPNRPTKLAEQYSELYDNQWTDTFEILSKHYPRKSDIKLTGLLYGMLVDSYDFCGEVRNKQKQALEDIILYPAGSTQSSQGRKKNEDINRIFAKTLTDAAKLSGNVTGANIAKIFLMSESTKEKYQEWTKMCETYLECCVRLCWLMQVQTPPLCFDVRNLSGKPFDKKCYKEYTKGGKTIAFVVWPALFLHENGPTLCKGIAQGQ